MTQETVTKTQEEEDLDYARNLRKAFIGKMVEKGAAPEDRGDKAILLSALKDIDSAALGRMRIKAEEKASKDGADSAALVAEMLKQVSSSMGVSQALVRREKPVALPDDIAPPELKPGEVEIGSINTTYDDFMSKMKPSEVTEEVIKPVRRD